MTMDADQILEHYGVRGMRWGQRKASGAGSSSKPSRKERRAQNRQDKKAFYDKKADHIIKQAMRGDKTLIRLNGQMVVTGKEFTNHLASGGAFNVKYTEVFATRTNSAYQQQAAIGTFKRNRS